MRTVNKVKHMQELANTIRNDGKTLSLVPTMGALHEGHLSLVIEAKKKADVCVVSIFVNPTQFGPGEDYNEYSRDLEGDLRKLKNIGVDIVFIPKVEEIYHTGFQTYVEVDELEKHLCGPFRKGHFRGVATIVLKLFNIVKPHVSIFGEKDYQQMKIIQRMVFDLNLEIEILTSPIIREEQGLALSSRNSYLSQRQKISAYAVFKALSKIKKEFELGSKKSKKIIESGKKILEQASITDIDYLDICDPETLQSKEIAESGDLLAIAVRLGGTRLIDNIRL
ncbi:MAG: pantoate--beta-alanine ligase [Thermodesulfobacteriota bacterium]